MLVAQATEPRVVVQVNWSGYRKFMEAIGDAPGVRLTYDGGQLEIMTTGAEHESIKELVGRLLEVYMDESGIDFESGGAQTFKRKRLDKGFEPDVCWWVANYRRMLGVKRWDAARHPPPDVAVEVEITHGFIERLPIFAALGVPEVWWYHDDSIEILLLQPGGQYRAAESSSNYPDLRPQFLMKYVRLKPTVSTSEILRLFRRDLRATLEKPKQA